MTRATQPVPEHAFIGQSPVMHRVRERIGRLAQSDCDVLITGETGTGKEVAARSIHLQSRRARGPFVAVNTAGITESLFESEMFGYEPGAFTGANRRNPGKMEVADGGVLFLDESGDLPLSCQSSLLRAVENREFRRLGGTHTVSVDIRIVAATNADLKWKVRNGTFRADFYHRIKVGHLHLPPLREHVEDIPELIRHFMKLLCSQDRRHVVRVSPAAEARLLRYAWPGNVRELKHELEGGLALCQGEILELEHLSEDFVIGAFAGSPKDEIAKEAEVIREVLSETRWNRKEAARRLGWSRSKLYRKLDKYGIK